MTYYSYSRPEKFQNCQRFLAPNSPIETHFCPYMD